MADREDVPPIDEMVDGRGGVRPHWRPLLGSLGSLGEGALAERGRRLDRAFEDEGIAGVLPGAKRDAAWRCDPLPMVLSAQEFAALEAGIIQRARLLEALLADLYGPQAMLAEGLVPPQLVFANPGFLRGCHIMGELPPRPLLHLYAADLVRGPDGAWRVLADRTSAPAGPGMARENRRLLGRVMPEAFRGAQVRSMRPFFDLWQDALQRLAPPEVGDPAVALLTRGSHSPRWFEDMLLSRELSCALVESGDLTQRGGRLFLKTLQGLQRVDVLLSRVDGATLDPLETPGSGTAGVPGLFDAARNGAVRILNAPGAALAEAPALAAFLPALARRLLGEHARAAVGRDGLAGRRGCGRARRRRARLAAAPCHRRLHARGRGGRGRGTGRARHAGRLRRGAGARHLPWCPAWRPMGWSRVRSCCACSPSSMAPTGA